MTGSLILGLLQNTAILLAFTMVYDTLWIHRGRTGSIFLKILTGILIGGIGIILMLSPWTLVPGLGFDTRTILLSVTGLFFGAVPAITAMAIDIIYRIFLGGSGVYMGIATIVSAGSIGMLWRLFRYERLQQNRNIELIMLGTAVHAAMLLGIFLLPQHLQRNAFATIFIPIVLVYIPATVLLGRLMISQYEHWLNRRIKEQLLESEKKLNQELIVAKEKAEESDRLKSSFLANLSHEIRTPLNGILGFADILQNPSISSDELRDYLQMIRISGNRMLEIMQNLIDISKLESGTMKVHTVRYDLNEQFDNLYFNFVAEAKEKGLSLSYKKAFPGEPRLITTDEEKINSIMSNLLKNSVKFSTGGTIEFGYTINEDGCYEFYVTDEGPGIAPDRQNAVFERFIQAETSNSSHEGAGLGLSIAKAFVEMMHGSIWINSVVGRGTEVRFTIPVKPEHATTR